MAIRQIPANQSIKNDSHRTTKGFPGQWLPRKSCFWSFAMCLLPLCSNAQDGAPAPPPPPDTSALFYTFALTPERNYPADDTLPDRDFRMYDPARRRQLIDWGTLGNLGSSARPLLFELPARRGFDFGEHAFDLYRVKPEDLRFYRDARAFSDVFFSQGANQQQGMLNALFSRTFEGGANFSLDYRSINHTGQYRYQRNRHNSLSFGVWLPKGSRYDGFAIFSKNVMRQQENGGIVSDTVFGDGQFAGPINAEIRLPDQRAASRLADQTLQLTQHLKFTGDDEAGRRALRATHTLAWKQESFKFSDANLAQDSFFFDTFFVDRRGIRHFASMHRVDNTFAISTFKTKSRGRPSDVLSVGVAHTFFKVKQEPLDSSFSNLFLTGDFSITPSDGFALYAKGSLGMLANFGEYQVSGELALGLGKVGQLRAGLLSQRRPPSLLHYRLFVSQRLFWQNNFEKPVENTLYATYSLPFIGLSMTARAHLVSNYLYYNQAGVATQTTSPMQVVQFIVSEDVRFGPLHLDNTVALQQSTRADLVRLPRWFSKNSLYFSGKIFKKRLQFDAGADFRINSDFRPDGYQPLTWQFHLQDTLTQKPYPWLDLFVAFKVQSLRGFVRYENFMTNFNKTSVFYQTAYYPQPFGGLRFGVSWRFLDSTRPDPNQSPPTDGVPGGIGPTGSGRG
ncbi:MAG: hypothetical protein KF734_09435 [Saprospiraceae bacterium]|nr:hypothetical protein [Saprospiraceae bacterium]